MRVFSNFVAAFLVFFVLEERVQAQTCASTPTQNAIQLGTDGNAEVYGETSRYQTYDNGWVFGLERKTYGWSLRLYDRAQTPGQRDLTSITPPLRGVPNPRNIDGWHFRNASNTAANDGSVNAPQRDRLFQFSLPAEDGTLRSETGRGWLKILDFGLADLEPGQRARMNYLKFTGCLMWPKTEGEIRQEADAKSPFYIDEEREIFGACGLDLATYDLDATILPRTLEGDVDGDDVGDAFAQIRRKSDGARGLALCRAGTWLSTIGFDGPAGISSSYIGQLEAWALAGPKDGPFGYEGEPEWPDVDGHILVIERIEKEMRLVYWANGQLKTQTVYRFVEP